MLSPFPTGFISKSVLPKYSLTTLANIGYDDCYEIATTNAGISYVTSGLNNCIFRISASGNISVWAGDPVELPSTIDGVGGAARFNQPVGIVLDSTETYLYVSENGGHVIRRIEISTASVTTVAGLAGSPGDLPGTGSTARFNSPQFLCRDDSNNIYIVDYGNVKIKKMTTPGYVVTDYAGNGSLTTFDNLDPSLAGLGIIRDVAYDPLTGDLYFADANGRIRKVASGPGAVTTYIGSTGAGYLDGPAATAKVSQPQNLVLDYDRKLFIVDSGNHRIREVDLAVGVVSTSSGNGVNSVVDNASDSLLGSHSTPMAISAVPSNASPMYYLIIDYTTGSPIRKLTKL